MTNDLKKVIAFMKNIHDLPDTGYFSETDKFDELFYFVYNFVSKLYGQNYLQNLVNNKPGTNLWDYITMSDIAYVICLILNSEKCWFEEYERKTTLTKEELDKWKPKIRNTLPVEERAKYTKSKTLYTGGKGMSKRYKIVGWNMEGQKTYIKYRSKLKTLTHNETFYDARTVAWEQYLEDHKGKNGSQYSRKKSVPAEVLVEETDEEYDALQAELGASMSFHTDFVAQRPWEKKKKDLEEEDDIEESDDEEDTSIASRNVPHRELEQHYSTKKNITRRRKRTRDEAESEGSLSESEESDSDDDDEEEVVVPKRKKTKSKKGARKVSV